MSNKVPITRPRLRDFRHPRYWKAWLAFSVFGVCAVMPQRLTWLLGVCAGEAAFRLHRTRTIKTNVRMCFPDKSEHERRAMVRRYYHHVGQAVLDLGMAWMGPASWRKRRVRVVGGEHYRAAREAGHGVILLAPHFIGLEIGWARLSQEWPMAHMYRRPRNDSLHEALVYCRTHNGGIGFERYANPRPLVQSLRRGEGLYYSPDQDPDHKGKDNFVYAPFFGIPTATFTATSRIARMGNAVVIPCFTRQLPRGRGYEVTLAAPLTGFPGGSELDDALRLNQELEQGVLGMPDQYFWSYRRFKTRPDGMPSPYRRP